MAQARSRKRRPQGPRRAPAGSARKPDPPAKARAAGGVGGVRSSPAASTYGERPHAPWHPLPLSELLILIGAIGAALGYARGAHSITGGGRLLLAGLGALGVGTIEVALREHRSGYRSHTLLLAFLLVLVLDAALVIALSSFTSLPRLFDLALVVADVALFAFLFKLLRTRFLDARHARVIREG
jgi:hypothetical protein